MKMLKRISLKICFFFRKPIRGFNSIEELFQNVQSEFPAEIQFYNHEIKYLSKGILRRLLNILDAYRKHGGINHITGDIHYIAL